MNRTMAFIAAALLAVAPLAAQSIHVDAPNGGETLTIGAGCDIRWTATRLDQNVKIILVNDGGGIAGQIAGELAPGSSPFRWTVGGIIGGSVGAGRYKVRVAAMDGGIKDISDAAFTITSGGAPPSGGEPALAITLPRGGESYAEGDPQTISWTAANLTDSVHIWASRDSQRINLALRVLDPAVGSFTWNVHPFRDVGAETEPAGDYFIVLHSGSLTVQSGRFRIAPLSGHDFTISDPVLEERSGGKGFRVNVTSTADDYRGPLTLFYYTMGMGLGHARRGTYRVDLRRGVPAPVTLLPLAEPELFNGHCDVSFRFDVNPDRELEERDYGNNTVQKKFCWQAHDSRLLSVRLGRNYTTTCEACSVVIRPADVESVDGDRVSVRLEVTVQNCGSETVRAGTVRVVHSWYYRDANNRFQQGSDPLGAFEVPAMEQGQFRILTPTVTLRRLPGSTLGIYYGTGESGALAENNHITFHPNFIGF